MLSMEPMNLLQDIDSLIICLLDLPELTNVVCTNKAYHGIIIKLPLVIQWKKLKGQRFIFCTACKDGYLEYAQSLYRRHRSMCKGQISYFNDDTPDPKHLNTILWLINEQLLKDHHLADIFENVCYDGDLQTAKMLISISKFNIHRYTDYAFRHSCQQGHLEVAKWLISLEDTHGKIAIHAHDDEVFYFACKNGHLDVAKWLITLENTHGKIDIHDIIRRINRSLVQVRNRSLVQVRSDIIQWLSSLVNTDIY